MIKKMQGGGNSMCKGPTVGEPGLFLRLEEQPAYPEHGEERGNSHLSKRVELESTPRGSGEGFEG